MLGLIDFSVSRSDLREIIPEFQHRVDAAIDLLAPVLTERVTLGGVRIYHESFARFLQKAIGRDEAARSAMLERIGQWLRRKGPDDERHFRFLIPTLSARAGTGK